MKLYRYVGPKVIADRVRTTSIGMPIGSADDVRAWVRDTRQELSAGSVIATFVVAADGILRVADRHSEHVACAGGQPVRAAGEITFSLGRTVEVVEVSNQSTGYCPEPESWPAVAVSLVAAGLPSPDGLTLACKYRRCEACQGLNLVKDQDFECGMCGADLPLNYNVQ